MRLALLGVWLAGLAGPGLWWWRHRGAFAAARAARGAPVDLGGRRDALLADLAPRLAHEVVTPLAAVRGHLDIVAEAVDEAAAPLAAASLRIGVTQLERVTALARDLLTLTAVRAGAAPRSRIRAAALAEEAAVALLPLADQREVRVEVVADPAAGVVEVAAGEIVRALRNLIENALRYGIGDPHPGPGSVRVSVAGEPAGVRFAVTDPGPGLSRAELERLSRPFHRGGAAVPGEGSGLGLAIVSEVLAAHGSALETGPGARLHFLLPRGRNAGGGAPPAGGGG